jgi:hypothetical protein
MMTALWFGLGAGLVVAVVVLAYAVGWLVARLGHIDEAWASMKRWLP